jgi:hypothetical protein
VPVPGDYDDGEIGGMIGRGRKAKNLYLTHLKTITDIENHEKY